MAESEKSVRPWSRKAVHHDDGRAGVHAELVADRVQHFHGAVHILADAVSAADLFDGAGAGLFGLGLDDAGGDLVADDLVAVFTSALRIVSVARAAPRAADE